MQKYSQQNTFDIAVIDFETATKNMNSPCQIGISFIRGLEIVDNFQSFIQPPDNLFEKENILIHGITPNQTATADSFDVVFHSIKEKLDKCQYLAAHNAHFDMSVLFLTLQFYGIEIPNYYYIDTIQYFSKAKDSNIGNSLAAIAHWLTLDMPKHHDALSDASVTAQALIKVTQLLGKKSVPTYLDNSPDVAVKSLKQIHPQTSFIQKKKPFETVSITKINQKEVLSTDSSHPFYQKNFVFTGDFALGKKHMMEMTREKGGVLKSTVSAKTNYLVEGIQDVKFKDENGLVSKQRKAVELIEKGHEIQRISEQDFFILYRK